MSGHSDPYPVGLQVDYAGRSDRLTAFFRILLAVPILVIVHLLLGEHEMQNLTEGTTVVYRAVGFVVGALLLMLLFRRRYPRWWFDWNRELAAFLSRVLAYVFLLRDEYPSVDEEQAVHLKMEYPDAGRELSRWLPLVKWLLAIPHVVVLAPLGLFQVVAVFLAWVAILFTGVYPRGLFDFAQGVMRWSLRVFAYALLMVTDRYPPFSLYE